MGKSAGSTATAAATVTATATVGSATKTNFNIENPDVKDLNEEAQKIIKGFQSDYTQKTTKLADERKGLEEKATKGEEWSTWFKDNEPLVGEFNEWKKNKDSGDGDLDVSADSTVNEEGTKVKGQIKNLETMYKTGFGMLLGLMKIQRGNPEYDIDAEKVITYAQKEGITDMEKAFKGAYSEEIITKRVKRGVEEAKLAWDEKHKTEVLSSKMPIGREVRTVIKAKKR